MSERHYVTAQELSEEQINFLWKAVIISYWQTVAELEKDGFSAPEGPPDFEEWKRRLKVFLD